MEEFLQGSKMLRKLGIWGQTKVPEMIVVNSPFYLPDRSFFLLYPGLYLFKLLPSLLHNLWEYFDIKMHTLNFNYTTIS
jgi:hypothetical protein